MAVNVLSWPYRAHTDLIIAVCVFVCVCETQVEVKIPKIYSM